MSVKKIMLYIGLSLVLFLSACGGQSPEEEVYDHLEEAVQLEADFASQQEVITNLEKQEKEIFDQIIELEMKDFDQIKALAQDALDLIEERSKEIEVEKESIDASREEFEKTKDYIVKIEDKAVQNKAQEMYDVMIDRYEAYNKIYKAYAQSLKEEETLYTMFQDEEITQDEYTEQTTKVNESYEVMLEENEVFNNDTSKYNELKKDFYDLANFNVAYDGNEED